MSSFTLFQYLSFEAAVESSVGKLEQMMIHTTKEQYIYKESLAYIQWENLNKLKNMTHLMNNPPCEWEEEAKMYLGFNGLN